MLYLGLISGTSMDAVDTALVDFDDHNIQQVLYRQKAIDCSLQKRLKAVDKQTPLEEILFLDVMVGRLFAEAVNESKNLWKVNSADICAIGSHGQTVAHHPDGKYPFTLQIGDPNIIAEQTEIVTVADFRRMDIAAGGQGAPITSAFHAHYFSKPHQNNVVLNIGGMANITVLPSNGNMDITGFDTGPGNILLDEWIQQSQGKYFDDGGKWGATGQLHPHLLNTLLEDPYFQRLPPKNTGRDYFNLAWLQQKLTTVDENISAENVQFTLIELTATSIADAIQQYAINTQAIFVCGGGIHNATLIKSIQAKLPHCVLKTTEQAFQINADAVEAINFAWLAKGRLGNLALNSPSVTGARKPVVLGAVYQPN